MGYVLPDGADAMLDLIGVGWPNVDEDDYRDMANDLRDFAEDVEDDAHAARLTITRLVSSGDSEALTALQGYWDKLDTRHMADLASAARLFATALDGAADVIAGRKAAAVGELVALAASIGIGLAAAPFTAGLSTLFSAGAIAATREVVRRLLREAMELAVAELVTALSEPAVQALESMATELVVEIAATGLGLQDEIDVGEVAQAGRDGFQEGAQSLNLASADGAPPSLGRAIGKLKIDDGEHDTAATSLTGVSTSVNGRTTGKLTNARTKQGKTRGKDELADAVNEFVDRGMSSLEKATKTVGDHFGGALPRGVRSINTLHGNNERDTKRRFDAFRIDEGRDGDGTRRGTDPAGPRPAPRADRPVPTRPDSLRTVKTDARTNGVAREDSAQCGDPIDIATGAMTLTQTDITLPGVLTLALHRTHIGTYRYGRHFGRSWASTLDERLHIDPDGSVVWAREDASSLLYPRTPQEGDDPLLPVEGHRLPLRRVTGVPGVAFAVTDPRTGITRSFAEPAAPLPQSLFDAPALCWLLSLTDAHGNEVEIVRDDRLAPTAVVHSGGYHVEIGTAPLHGDGPLRVTGIALRTPEGATPVTAYGYDDHGDLTTVTNSSGLPLRFTYDADSRVTSWTDRNDSTFRYVYDASGRVVETVGPDGSLSATLTYDTEARTTAYTDSLGHTTTYHLNRLGQVTTETDPAGHTTHQEWDRYDRLLSRTDPLGHTTTFTYDDAGNLTTVLRADGTTSTAAYNADNLPVEITAPDGTVWRHTYDAHRNRTSVTAPDGATTHFTHDPTGAPTTVTDALGHTQHAVNNAAGLPLTLTDAAGHTTTITRDAFGRPATVTDPLGAATRTEWTVEGRPARRIAPDGTTETWSWDGEGNCTSHTDPAGGTTSMEYGHFDKLRARTGPDGARYEFQYDTELRLTQVVNPNGLTWDYAYDATGRLTSETDFDSRTHTYTCDPAGRPATLVTPLGQRYTYTHDRLGRLLARNVDGVVTEYAYDTAGRLIRATTPTSALLREHDVRGRLLAESVDGRTIRYTYDLLGRRTSRTTPTGATTRYDHGPAGHRTRLDVHGHLLTFQHDPRGRELARTFGPTDQPVTLTTAFDLLGRPVEHTLSSPARVVRSRGYDYRADHHLVSTTDHLAGTTEHYTLDPVGRPLSVTADDWSETYAYDQAGNQTHAHWPDQAPHREARGERTYVGTRITTAGAVRYEHDAAGRTTLRQKPRPSRKPATWHYTWDAEDRLTTCTTPEGATWRYTYDPLGRRTGKQRLAPSGDITEEVLFTWDGSRLAEQLDTTTNTALTWEHEGHRPLTQIERRLEQATREEIDARFFAIVTDLVGAPTELVDESGHVHWHTRATLWGTTTWNRDATAYTPLRFPGQYADPETGLHYNHFRHYDPDTARYTTPDPLGLTPAPNPATYVHNPHTWIDPLGLAPECGGDRVPASRVLPSRNAAFRSAKRDLGIPNGRQPDELMMTSMTDRSGRQIMNPDGTPVLTREYVFTREEGDRVIIQDHSAGHYYGEGGVGDQGPHLNVRPFENPRTGKVPGTAQHYEY
ncbi:MULTISPECIES: HNH/endonuclease VII fold putative polymorphic toxin [Streptomyces]|uniref:HNH/endonuclease VII fold putative polymorphic toxin n=1 Tax=Streptomyces TaxID=1883 RepID=UPI002248BACE|nr:HNH/endonuclease VII fold putative polymorphic toxin [Streptomyces sp. JHD 1]MCX2967402.1 HNH/endonuclease VII fold putative polymorphic toxin [Streptomyces sp. JHD 1]